LSKCILRAKATQHLIKIILLIEEYLAFVGRLKIKKLFNNLISKYSFSPPLSKDWQTYHV